MHQNDFDLFSTAQPLKNVPEFSVSDLAVALKKNIESSFSHVRVRGEISGLKKHTSGHIYFSLKDENAILAAICWRGTSSSFSFPLEEGLEIIAIGRITTYPGRSQYQLVLEAVELAGQGALLKLLEERKMRLRQEGLFEAHHKKSLPFLPCVIGIITSPTGAVIQDILHRLQDRFPRYVLLWPTPVQGEGVEQKIVEAIQGFNALSLKGDIPRPDLLIIARGGGSLEDLWAFNDENVVRAAFNSVIPLISAIGHETDTTLLDLVADVRAPTPTAAAEFAVPRRDELFAKVLEIYRQLVLLKSRYIKERQEKVSTLSIRIGHPSRLLELKMQKLDEVTDRLPRSLENQILKMRLSLSKIFLKSPEEKIINAQQLLKNRGEFLNRGWQVFFQKKQDALHKFTLVLEALSYTKILEKGFVLVRDRKTQVPLTSVHSLQEDQIVSLIFKDGEKDAQIISNKGK